MEKKKITAPLPAASSSSSSFVPQEQNVMREQVKTQCSAKYCELRRGRGIQTKNIGGGLTCWRSQITHTLCVSYI